MLDAGLVCHTRRYSLDYQNIYTSIIITNGYIRGDDLLVSNSLIGRYALILLCTTSLTRVQ